MIVATQKNPEDQQPILLENFPGGLNSSVPAEMIGQDELAVCTNWKYNYNGQLVSRDAVTKYTDAVTSGGVVTIGYAKIDGTNRTLIGDSNNNVYYIGGTSGLTPTLVDAVAGTPEFLGYNNICFVLDGSYIKYMDDVASVKMAYDDTETFYDNYDGEESGSVAISTSGVGCTFTTPAWDTGFTIPPTTISAKVIATTGGAATVDVEIYDVAGSAQAATISYSGTITTAAADFIEVTFTSSDITTELDPETEYYCLLKGENVNLYYTTVSTGGAMITSAGAVTTQQPIMMIQPGLPPKAAYGTISDKRPHFWGDPDNKGTDHYGKLTHLEYGSITSVDSDNNSFEIGAMCDLYGDLWAFGTQDNPYMAALVGDTESAWELRLKFQEAWALPKTIRNIGNDIFTGNTEGVDSLAGIQEYGDVRSSSESNKIKDRFRDYGVSTAFAGYYPMDGQYWLHLPGYANTLVCHTKHPMRPWVEYLLPVTPTYFKQAGSLFLIGCADKYVYRLNPSSIQDLGTTDIAPTFKTAYITFPFAHVNLNKFQFLARSDTGGDFTLKVYINGDDYSETLSKDFSLAISSALTVDDLTMAVDSMLFTFDIAETPPYCILNINCWSVQFEITSVEILGDSINFNGIFVKYTRLEE